MIRDFDYYYVSLIFLANAHGLLQLLTPFERNLHESRHKTNQIWVDKGNEFNKRLIELWLRDNDIEMY